MPKCSVISCPNNSRHVRKKDGVSYFSFPRNPIRCSEWTVIIAKARNELNYKPYKGSVVCSNHFPASDIYTTTKGFSRLNKNAKPILHLNKKQLRSYDSSDQDNTHVNLDHDNNQQTIKQNEDSIELSFDIDNEFGNDEEICQQTNVVCLQVVNLRHKIV
ncbi:unnamed protein product [Parnassius apollo]|uniref:(apollo) hypothetical protein n=1 Tax=Parnassius apollo TaxID=110799 RepID=A0A8S3Y966_PARAO|nr:unnamed protein product [Parnassius apollo]